MRVHVLSLDFVLPLRYEGVSSLWGDFSYPPLSSITLDSNHKYMKGFNPIGSLVVLVGALVLIIPALLDKGGNVYNLIGCVVMIAGFLLHIFLNKRITTIKE